MAPPVFILFAFSLLLSCVPAAPVNVFAARQAAIPDDGSLKVTFENPGNYKFWVSGLTSDGTYAMVTSDGQFYYTQPNQDAPANTAIPCASGVTIPGYMTATRIFVSDGDLPFSASASHPLEPSFLDMSGPSAKQNWGFVEFTSQPGHLYANIGYVDFVGLPLGIASGTLSAQGATADAVSRICSTLSSAPGAPWSSLCIPSETDFHRVVSPQHGTGFDTYWDAYVEEVWDRYAGGGLSITTTDATYQCRTGVDGDLLDCGAGGTFARPSTAEIWACDGGPFAVAEGGPTTTTAAAAAARAKIVPILCAAFHRGTLHNNPAQPAPADQFYADTAKPLNWYCKAVHDNESDGKGYCFPYDDVAPAATPVVAAAGAGESPAESRLVVEQEEEEPGSLNGVEGSVNPTSNEGGLQITIGGVPRADRAVQRTVRAGRRVTW